MRKEKNMERKSQVISEYFIILTIMVILTVVGFVSFLNKIKTKADGFFNKKMNEVVWRNE